MAHPLAGKPAPRDLLVDVPDLLRRYVADAPDPKDPLQRVAFGTSGHRGSSFRQSFNEAHILAISQAICAYRLEKEISGPLYLGKDTHALSEPAAVTALQQRLNDRLADVALKLDPQRIAQEVALLVERSDISEEVARLKIHAAELGELLAKGGEVGKKLDFMLQEMNRETNTILSKTSNAGEPGVEISRLALNVKAEIEKIREQSLNVE